MSWLGKTNYYFLQWFFIRLAKVVEQDDTVSKWMLMLGVLPMSGWVGSFWPKYKYVWHKKSFNVTLWKRK